MEKINTLKPDYRIMNVVLNQCMRLSKNKAMFVVLLNTILVSIMGSFALSPIYMGFMKNRVTTSTLVLTLVLSFVVCVVSSILSYGVRITCSKLIEKSSVTVGHLFSGFRDKTKKVWIISLILNVLNVVVSCIAFYITWKILTNNGTFNLGTFFLDEKEGADMLGKTSLVLTSVLFVVQFLVRLPFAYLWLVIYRRGDLGIFKTIWISVSLFFRQFFRFVGYIFYACWRELVALFILILINYFLPTSEQSMSFSLLGMVLSFFQLVQEFKLLVKVNMAVPLYFYSMTGVLEVHVSEYKEEEGQSDSENDSSDVDSDSKDEDDNSEEEIQ